MSGKRSEDPARLLANAGVKVIGNDRDQDGEYWLIECSEPGCHRHYSWQMGEPVSNKCPSCRHGKPCDYIVVAGQIYATDGNGMLPDIDYIREDQQNIVWGQSS